MKKLANVTFEQYSYGDYIIDIITNKKYFNEIYLSHKQYGTKMYMFGIYEKDKDILLEIIEANVEEEIEFYKEDYIH